MSTKKNYRKGAVAIIINKDNDFLIIQKTNYSESDWTIIGGGREKSETKEENIFREILEEINIGKGDLEILGVSSQKLTYDYPANVAMKVHGGNYVGQSYDQLLVRFHGSDSDIQLLPTELRTYKWVNYKDLKEHLRFPNQWNNVDALIQELYPELRN